MRETRVQSLGWEDFLEKEMATHSSILATVINIFLMKITKEFHFADKKFRTCMVVMVTQQWYCT